MENLSWGWRFPESVWARSPENWTLSPALSLSHFLKGCDEKILGSSLGTVSLSSAGKHRLQASVNSCLDALGEFPILTYFVFNIELALMIESYDLYPLAGIYIFCFFSPLRKLSGSHFKMDPRTLTREWGGEIESELWPKRTSQNRSCPFLSPSHS